MFVVVFHCIVCDLEYVRYVKKFESSLDDLMEQEGDWDKIYNHFGYMAENETEAKRNYCIFFAVESIYALRILTVKICLYC